MNRIGDVISRQNIKFKDNGKLDSRITGHPTINISDEIDGKVYYIVATSSKRIIQRKFNFYRIQDKKNSRLRKQSYVNLDLIYEEGVSNKVEVGYITPPEMLRIIKEILSNFDNILKINTETIDEKNLLRLKEHLIKYVEEFHKEGVLEK